MLQAVIDERTEILAGHVAALRADVLRIESGPLSLASPAGGPIGRGVRSQAMKLLRSGTPRSTIAQNLQLGAKEVDLIAAMSEVLSLPDGNKDGGALQQRIRWAKK